MSAPVLETRDLACGAGGLGGRGGAQPLAAVMAGASCLAVECQPSRIAMRLKTGYLDRMTASLDEAREIAQADPFVISKLRTFEVREWTVMEGSIGVTVNLSTRRYSSPRA